jgi:hypothetical protein
MKFLRGELAAKQALLEVLGHLRAGLVELDKRVHSSQLNIKKNLSLK